MKNIITPSKSKYIINQKLNIKLRAIHELQPISIFTLPTRINDRDIAAMFKGLINLIREKIKQEQTESFLQLKLKYQRLKFLHEKLKLKNNNILIK